MNSVAFRPFGVAEQGSVPKFIIIEVKRSTAKTVLRFLTSDGSLVSYQR